MHTLRFRIMLIMILIGIIPTVIVETVVLRNYESRAVSSRSVTIRNQCEIIRNKLAKEGYLENPDNDDIEAQLVMRHYKGFL